MKVIITGGAGYLGSVLTALLLAEGHQVRVLDSLAHGGESLLGAWCHPGFEFVRGDIRDRATVKAAVSGRDAVVHLAAIVGDPACARNPDLARAINLDASLQLIEESKQAGVARFVFASTCSNYGRMKDADRYVDEESELSPVSLYAETKVAVELALLKSRDNNGWSPTPLRFATIYGVSPRMRFDLTVNEFTTGDADAQASQSLRGAVLAALRSCAGCRKGHCDGSAITHGKGRGRVFNVGATDQNFQKQQLVELIQPYAPDAVVEFVPKAEDPRDYRVSFSRIAGELGFETSRSVPQGIAEIARLVSERIIGEFDHSRYRN